MVQVSRRELGAVLGVGLVASACGALDRDAAGEGTPRASGAGSDRAKGKADGDTGPSGTGDAVPDDVAMEAPPKLDEPLLSSDVLVYGQSTLAAGTIAQIRKLQGVEAVEAISMGSFFVAGQEVTYAAVDPATFRRFTPPGTAQTQAVWDRVAGGEIAVDPGIAKRLEQEDGYLRLGNESQAQRIHIGAYAQLLDPTKARRVDAVLNYKWVEKLGMRRDNAVIVAMGSRSPQSVRKPLQKFAGTKASVQILGPDLDIGVTQTAFLTGGNVAREVGSFSYRANPDGTVTPDPKWVAAKIRTEEMPIIGRVTGNVVMLPQLRAALREVVTRGLSSKIYTYDGCYVPRFIAKDPSKGLSFHTYGTAIDLNARDNYRGIPGKMDRQVVAIFKKWGFAWGGDWNYTDPMHFELARLVKAR